MYLRHYFVGLLLLATSTLCALLTQENVRSLTEATPVRSTLKQSAIDYYKISDMASDENLDSKLFISFSICSAPESGLEESPKLFYHLGGVPELDLLSASWIKSSVQDTFGLINPGLVGVVSENTYADYYFGYRAIVVDLATLGRDDSVYLAVSGADGIDYQIGYSESGFPDLLVFNFTTQLLDSSDRAVSILVDNHTITNFNSAVLHVTEFQKNRRFNSLCSLQNTPDRNQLAVNSAGFKASIEYQQPSVSKAKSKIYHEAYLDGLDPDTPYVAWLTIPSYLKASSGVTFPPVYFHTKKKNPKCFLARDLDTCKNVYHSIYIPDSKPNTSTVPTSELGYLNWTSNYISQRSDFVNRHYDAFLKALKQYDCKAHPFSPVRNCDDCRVSYKNWLCAIAFPKCGQRPPHITDFIRTPYFDNLEGDLLTIKPCAFLCHYVIQDCPSMLKFRCPVVDDTYEKYFPTKNEIWSWAEYELQFRKYPFSSNTTPPIQKNPFCNAMLSSLRLPSSEYIFKSSSQISPVISILPLLVILVCLYV